MVAHITEGTAFDKHGRPFRRRNHLPAIWFFVALALVTLVVWVIALNRPADLHEIAACNDPPVADTAQPEPTLGQQVSRSEMVEVEPAKLADTNIRVLNASGQGGQAARVANALDDLGFGQTDAANDPLYANARLECYGQIRFGPSGRAAAAAVWLVAPCTELFDDGRPDDTVDLALGTQFTELSHSDDIDKALTALLPNAEEPPDSDLLTEIQATSC